MIKKFCPSHSISQEPYIIWFLDMLHMYKVVISSGIFFHSFKIFIFWINRVVKWQEMTQSDKKVCLPLILIVIFGTHNYWWYIQKFFSFFQKFDFFGLFFGKRVKNDLKLPISVCYALYLKNCRSYHWDFWYTGVK